MGFDVVCCEGEGGGVQGACQGVGEEGAFGR